MRGLGVTLGVLGVAYGWVAAAVVWRRLLTTRHRRSPPLASVAGGVALLASLALPYADGYSRSTGRPIRLAGWEALDGLSLATVVVVGVTAAVAAGRIVDDGAALVPPAALHGVLAGAALALLVGKWLVYLGYDHYGPSPWGFAVAAAGTLAVAGGGASAPPPRAWMAGGG